MIVKDIAEYEDTDSQLSKDTILKLHNEIERLKEQLNDEIEEELKQSEIMVQKKKEIERLHSIIKEVREYIMTELITEWNIKNGGNVSGSDLPVYAITPILDILDKENKE